jgi:hypothetical protein
MKISRQQSRHPPGAFPTASESAVESFIITALFAKYQVHKMTLIW